VRGVWGSKSHERLGKSQGREGMQKATSGGGVAPGVVATEVVMGLWGVGSNQSLLVSSFYLSIKVA